jgi:hypothetical protein
VAPCTVYRTVTNADKQARTHANERAGGKKECVMVSLHTD